MDTCETWDEYFKQYDYVQNLDTCEVILHPLPKLLIMDKSYIFQNEHVISLYSRINKCKYTHVFMKQDVPLRYHNIRLAKRFNLELRSHMILYETLTTNLIIDGGIAQFIDQATIKKENAKPKLEPNQSNIVTF